MISSGHTVDLFKLQKELLEAQVDMAVSRTIDRVVDQISALRNEMNSQIHGLRDEMNSQIHGLRDEMNSQIHGLKADMISLKCELKDEMNSQIHGVREDMHALRHEMRDGFSSLNTRVSNLETKLKIVNAPKKEVRSNFIRYSFKAVWAILGISASVVLSYFAIHFF